MASLLRRMLRRTSQAYSPMPLKFPSAGFEIVPESEVLEEERLDEFRAGLYYPVHVGDVYDSKYQVVGKLGFGSTSTVWLARKLDEHKHVALKIFTRGRIDGQEFEMSKTLSMANPSHPGFKHIRTALDTFVLSYPGGDHHCLVQKPMWDSWKDLLRRNPTGRFTQPLLKAGLKQVFSALDYLHNECKLVHTDIKADNILHEIVDEGILEAFTQAELTQPSRRKVVNGAPIYSSRTFQVPRDFGNVVLSDFGAAVEGDQKRNHNAQPNVYRSPDIMLKTEWSYAVDIWNVGAMVWDLFEGKHLFYGDDEDGKGYSTRAHLAEVMALLGPPPLTLLQRGIRSREFFTEEGQWKADVSIPQKTSLEQVEMYLDGTEKDDFLDFMRTLLQWRPEDRWTAQQLVRHPWLSS